VLEHLSDTRLGRLARHLSSALSSYLCTTTPPPFFHALPPIHRAATTRSSPGNAFVPAPARTKRTQDGQLHDAAFFLLRALRTPLLVHASHLKGGTQTLHLHTTHREHGTLPPRVRRTPPTGTVWKGSLRAPLRRAPLLPLVPDVHPRFQLRQCAFVWRLRCPYTRHIYRRDVPSVLRTRPCSAELTATPAAHSYGLFPGTALQDMPGQPPVLPHILP